MNAVGSLDALTQEQCAALDAGTLVHLDLHGIRIAITPPLPLSRPHHPETGMAPPAFDQQKYIRAWDLDTPWPYASGGAVEGEITVDDRDTYRVYGKVDLESSSSSHSSHVLATTSQTYYLLGRLASTEYYLLEYQKDQYGKVLMPIEDTPASATVTGPTDRLPSLFSPALFNLLKLRHLAVALSPGPITEVPPPLRGDLRGYSNMPPLASRVVPYGPAITQTLTPAIWGKLLHLIGKLVDVLCHSGTAIALRCRETFNPRTEEALSTHPIVIITARPDSSEAARDCIYQTQHILCLHNYCDTEVVIAIGNIFRAVARPMPRSKVIKYTQYPSMGVSISPDEPGTRGAPLGSFVHVSRDNQRIQGLFMMTNHHVVLRDKKSLAVQETNLNRPINCPTKPLVDKSLEMAKEVAKKETEEHRQSENTKIGDESRRATEIHIAKTRLDQAEQRETTLDLGS